MLGIIPAAGSGTRIQPLAFSKELLPVGSTYDGSFERPRAVSEYLVDRMIRAGAHKICFVISANKTDIIKYFGGKVNQTQIIYIVQEEPKGLCDAIFRALPIINEDEQILIGLPDTIWFPVNGFSLLPDKILSFLLFKTENREFFDSVELKWNNEIQKIHVKDINSPSDLIWGAFKMSGNILMELYYLWKNKENKDEYIGTLINSYLENGGYAYGINMGESYVDVGTLNGYKEAIALLNSRKDEDNFLYTKDFNLTGDLRVYDRSSNVLE